MGGCLGWRQAGVWERRRLGGRLGGRHASGERGSSSTASLVMGEEAAKPERASCLSERESVRR